MPDHVHMMLSIPPKYAVSQVVGYMKGKSAIHIARTFGERKRNFVGQHFWDACVEIQACPIAAVCKVERICAQVGANCGAEYSDASCTCLASCGRLEPNCL